MKYFVIAFQIEGECLQVSNVFRATGTIGVRLSSDLPPKSRKAVGYWLLTCSGMVFVAVVLGSVVVYYVILIGVCIVLKEIIKKTVR